MARIEELPDDIDVSKMNIHEHNARPEKGTTATITPHTNSMADTLKEMSKTPLFMQQSDISQDPTSETQDNTLLDAMRALQYEGTRREVAQGFREQGNELARVKKWKDAREFYSKAIAVLLGKVDIGSPPPLDTDGKVPEEMGEDEKEKERREEQGLLETCYVNRALCQLSVGNYRSTVNDAAAALRINPGNVKALYRSAMALLKTEKIAEADDCCTRGLKLDPSNAQLKKLEEDIAKAKAKQEQVLSKKQKETETRQREQMTLGAALKARGIQMRKSAQPPNLEDAVIHLSPDPLSPTSQLVFPVLLLYPVHEQSDFIKKFNELETIAHHLKYVFPPPWDEEGLYEVESVECFMSTTTGGLIKVGKKLSLLKLLSTGKTEVLDGLVSINVLPKSRVNRWVDEMKQRKER